MINTTLIIEGSGQTNITKVMALNILYYYKHRPSYYYLHNQYK